MKNIQEKKWILNPFQPGIKAGISTKAEEQLFDLSVDTLLKMDCNNKKLIQNIDPFHRKSESTSPFLNFISMRSWIFSNGRNKKQISK